MRFLERGHLPAQLQELLVEQVDPRPAPRAERADLSASSLESAAMRASFSPPPPAMPAEPVALRLQGGEVGLQGCEFLLQRLALALLQAQQVGELGDLALEAAQYGILA